MARRRKAKVPSEVQGVTGIPREDKKWAFHYHWKILGDDRAILSKEEYKAMAPILFPAMTTELRFNPPGRRAFRLDWCFLPEKVGIEVQGIGSKKSGHTTFKGYIDDCEKMRDAQEQGWRILYVVPQELENDPSKIINQVLRILKG